MEPRLRASPQQFSALIDFMERYGDLGRHQSGLHGRIKADQLWLQLADILNSLSGGVTKSSEKWKKVWADWKTKTKKKYLSSRLQASRTGGGPSKLINLTTLEERVVAVIGGSAKVGQAGVQEQNLQAESAVDYALDILDDNNSQNSAITTHASPAQPKLKQELRDEIENMINTNNYEMRVTISSPQSMSLQSTSPQPSLPTSSPCPSPCPSSPPSPHPLPSPQPMTSKESCNCQTSNKRSQEGADKSFPECSIAKKSKLEEYNDKKEANKMFLLSLLPDINEMSPSQIRRFKKKVMDMINYTLENTST